DRILAEVLSALCSGSIDQLGDLPRELLDLGIELSLPIGSRLRRPMVLRQVARSRMRAWACQTSEGLRPSPPSGKARRGPPPRSLRPAARFARGGVVPHHPPARFARGDSTAVRVLVCDETHH